MSKTYAHFAAILAASFVTDTRHSGDKFVKLTDDAPEWITAAVYAAHGGRMPSDQIYSLCASIASDLTEYGDVTDDALAQIADGVVSGYHMDRYRWLADHLDNADFCEDAQADGLVSEDASISDRIAAGMYVQADNIARALHEAILAQAVCS